MQVEKNLILEKEDKSFLRKKWEEILKKIILNKVPSIYKLNQEVVFLNNEEELKNFFSEKNIDIIKKTKIIVITIPLNNFTNLISFLDKIDKLLDDETRIIINYFSISWNFIFKIFSFFKLIKSFKGSLFFSKKTFNIFLNCTNFEISHKLNDVFLPLNVPIISKFLLILVNLFPFLSIFSFANIFYLRKKVRSEKTKKLMSLIIPCRNEENGIVEIIEEAKKYILFPYQIVFVNDLSDDKTLNNMNLVKSRNPEINIKIINANGEGKSRAVDKGVVNSDGYFCTILDADLTVRMKDVNLFYSAISIGNGDLINGSRLIYKLNKNSMRLLNFFGNKFFSIIISYITSSRVTDTLCGTKCFRKNDWDVFEAFRAENKLDDFWGDFNLIFASSFYGYKLIDLPIRYYERVSGETKMKKRFYYFLNMFKLCIIAFSRFKLSLK